MRLFQRDDESVSNLIATFGYIFVFQEVVVEGSWFTMRGQLREKQWEILLESDESQADS